MRSIDWTQVLVFGVPAYIAAIGGAVAAVIGSFNRRSLKTSNGKTIAEAVEATHEVASDTNDKVTTMTETLPPALEGGSHV